MEIGKQNRRFDKMMSWISVKIEMWKNRLRLGEGNIEH